MEPDTLDVSVIAQAAAIMVLIEVVLFALWTEYTINFFEELVKDSSDLDRNLEVEKVRIVGLCGIVFQTTLLLINPEIRATYPIVSETFLIATLLLHLKIQISAESRIRPPNPQQPRIGKLLLRAGLSWLTSIVIYFACVSLSIEILWQLSLKFHFGMALEQVLLVIGGSVGVIFGLTINSLLTPVFMRWVLYSQPFISDSVAQFITADLENILKPLPTLYVIPELPLPVAPAILSGFLRTKGIFKQTLFISKTAVNKLPYPDLKVLIFNEASHFLLRHGRKKLLLTACLVVGSTIASLFVVLAMQHFYAHENLIKGAFPFIALGCFFISLRIIAKQTKRHELEADIHSVSQLGISFESFTKALRSADYSLEPRIGLNKGFPETELRIALLEVALNTTRSSPPKDDESFDNKIAS